ncbi:MAG: ATP-binding protein [Victivallaceae bacterium]
MKEIVIISGKGGTGKTSLTASFAGLAGQSVIADCDVDAADLHLLLKPKILAAHPFVAGHLAVIDPGRCRRCGRCAELCRFGAVRAAGVIDPLRCEGCGVCVDLCPAGAIAFPERHCGEYYESETVYGAMVHAKLAPAAENSGKLVSQVRRVARELAVKKRTELMLTDGPPGIGCPVIAALGGASLVLAVTEPTVSGEHDLERVLKLAAHFEIPALVCVNKFDLNIDVTQRIEAMALRHRAGLAGRIPYDHIFTEAMVNGELVIDYPASAAAGAIRKIWEHLWKIK